MTVKQIIKESENLNQTERQELISYFLFSTLNDTEKNMFFQLTYDENPSKFKFGMMKGMIKYMSDDFDEPLNEFKDYM